jgi:YVTN family beta-propeller protein
VIDLDTNTIVANVPTGTRPGVVSITPDDQYAYVGNISSNSVSIVKLDGASSTEEAELPCGVIGVSWAACGVSSDVRVSPDGAYCLVAASFDDRVKVIDTATKTIVADLAVGDFPLQIAFNADGSRAIVSNYSGDTYSIIDVDGASSSVVGTWAAGDGPLRVAYDQASDLFAVGLYTDRAVKMIDPSSGAVSGTYSYSGAGAVVDLDFSSNGSRLVLTAPGSADNCRMYRDGDYLNLDGSAVFFDYSDAAETAVAAVPGPDYAIFIDYTSQGMETHDVTVGGMPELSVFPNPGGGEFSFGVSVPEAGECRLSVYDLSGRCVAEVASGQMEPGERNFYWQAGVPAGVYAVRLETPSATVSKLLTVGAVLSR